MSYITTRVYNTYNIHINFPKVSTLAASISDNASRQTSIVHDSFEPLPRFKLVALPKDELGEFELELLAKAAKWFIPYNKTNPDFYTLEDDVCHYESLIKQTNGLEITWDYSFYDPVGLEQAIFDAENIEGGHSNSLYRDYYATRGV